MPSDDNYLARCLAKLASYGLTEDDAKETGVEFLKPSDTKALNFAEAPALKINYFHPLTGEAIQAPGMGPFYRLRYLGLGIETTETVDNDPNTVKEDANELEDDDDVSSKRKSKTTKKKKKIARYMQPVGMPSYPYFPLYGHLNWPAIFTDTSITIYLTEGEFKANKASREGLACIGIGGVWNWRSTKYGYMFDPLLDQIQWANRELCIIFDSDYKNNDNVRQALMELRDQLVKRGAIVTVVFVPDLPNFEKVGLDDLLVTWGRQATLDYVADNKRFMSITQHLFEMNDKFAFCKSPTAVVELDSGSILAVQDFEKILAAQRIPAFELRKDGSISMEDTSIAKEWCEWGMRNTVARIAYEPGKSVYYDERGERVLNAWRPSPVVPVEGDPSIFLAFVDYIFQKLTENEKRWVLQWSAIQFQRPGIKLATGLLFQGVVHGVGKSTYAGILGRALGDQDNMGNLRANFISIDANALDSDFNRLYAFKQLIVGEEIAGVGKNRRASGDFFKNLITQKHNVVNEKRISAFTVRDCANWIFNTNHLKAFYIEEHDRRIMSIAVPDELWTKPGVAKPYEELYDWLENKNGYGIALNYFKKLSLKEFEPYGPAPVTEAKKLMISLNRSGAEDIMHTLLTDPDEVLRAGNIELTGDLFEAEHLRNILRQYGIDLSTPVLTSHLVAAGFKRLKQTRLRDGKRVRPWVIRNRDSKRWVDPSPEYIRQYMESEGEAIAVNLPEEKVVPITKKGKRNEKSPRG